ncbi:DUF2254 domain-containing protein [Loktanella sp. SALINAS62]|uniref:DUF2254 domain-containing protein n=1 Tax=Loktanella sp. SALINAS62 TaxID=2706124 RepID=UPI001B8AF4B9|nr:DUF2254 domain-containing protein [Loktanella sp. SALINAS62]MBS1303658.1 DUF2254 domain-containing protein [Loktanella sp. SALINAS62]
MSSLKYHLSILFQRIWVPIGAYGLLGIVAAAMAYLFRGLIPESLAFQIGADAIDSILNILASSMLAVTTFSLSIMLAAFNSASSSATPRAFLLLKTDQTAQQVLASFIGAFIFSLVGIISLQIGIYGEGGRVILFGATLLVLALIIVNLVRWIGHLTDFGRLGDTVTRVEEATLDAMTRRLATPFLGARPLRSRVPDDAVPLNLQVIGHVRFIDLPRLNELASDNDATFYLNVLPGEFVTRDTPMCYVASGPIGDDYDKMLTAARACFQVGMIRSFDQDPRFGLIVMSEIASRALSPAVNDPGTSIDVIRRMTRVLSQWDEVMEPDVIYPQVFVRGLRADEAMRDAFQALARDGAALFEVQIALQKALLSLTRLHPGVFGPSAVGQSSRAMIYSEDQMLIEHDIAQLRVIAAEIADIARSAQDRGVTGRI